MNKDYVVDNNERTVFTVTLSEGFTVPDFEIIYKKEEKTYSYYVETIYEFSDASQENLYLIQILGSLEKWMKENNYNTKCKLPLHSVSSGNSFGSVEELYSCVKIMFLGFIKNNEKFLKKP